MTLARTRLCRGTLVAGTLLILGSPIGRADAVAPALTIAVEVRAEDARGRPVTQLDARDVELRQDGVVQRPLTFQALPAPGLHELRYTPSTGRPGPLTLRPLRAGLTISAPDGKALRPRVLTGPSALEQELGALLDARPEADEVHTRGAALLFDRDATGTRVVAVVEAPIADLHLQPEAGLPTAHVQLLARVKDERGVELARVSGDRSVVAGAGLAARRLVWTGVLRVPPGRHTLETLARDVATSRVGIQRLAFEIPPATSGLALSSTVLLEPSGSLQLLTDANEADDPLFFGGVALMPALRLALPRGTAIPVQFFAVVYPDRASTAPTRLRAELLRDGRVLGGVDLELPAPDARGAQPYSGQLATRSLAAAEYVLRLVATQGDARALSEAAFTMADDTSAAPRVAPR